MADHAMRVRVDSGSCLDRQTFIILRTTFTVLQRAFNDAVVDGESGNGDACAPNRMSYPHSDTG